MNIGFDAKRAYHNQTGLGHYSRTLIKSLAEYYPEHHYFLFNPKHSKIFELQNKNISEVLPTAFFHKAFPSLWRTRFLWNDMEMLKLDLFHGLSHELPFDIAGKKIKSVVTMHDLIHERFPHQYPALDRFIYTRKFKYACNTASHIIAISEQTKKDLIELYHTPEEKITVCYQSCNPAFATKVSEETKQLLKKQYDLPGRFYLYVGSVIERKNLLTICKALAVLKNNIPLVVIGSGSSYMQKVKSFIAGHNLTTRVIFLSEHKNARLKTFKDASDFPGIYQCALAMIYPSVYEGFGIPILEAMNSGIPVITSNTSCLPETGGNAALFVNPFNENEMAEAMITVAENSSVRNEIIAKGFLHVQHFTAEKCAAAVMNVYKKL